MKVPLPAPLADRGAARIRKAFLDFERAFHRVTARAASRFEARDWHGIQADAQMRLELYRRALDELLADLGGLLGSAAASEALWREIREAYARRSAAERNPELARTFFNSTTRRVFATVGVNPEIEFTAPEPALGDARAGPAVYRRYPADGPRPALVRRILDDYPFAPGYRDADADAAAVAARLDAALVRAFGDDRIDAVECLRPVFYRNKGAYVVGRARRGGEVLPVVLPLLNDAGGVRVDALLTDPDEVSVVFSFTRSYFLVDTNCPRELIAFLKSMMPLKPIAELYIALGFNKHGKTELYRGLMRHLDEHDDRFVLAAGDPGMVMLVFTLPRFDVVFKVIQDRFPPPKSSTRRDVIERYRLVFQHDRVGRLIDAQEFEHLEFPRRRFSDELLAHLLERADRTVELRGADVVIKHLYAERRVTPLNLYLRRVDEAEARRAVIDWGAAIKELAAANIFPGDFLLKNFGVTRHGRVVFYDYDELCLLEDCRFRDLPPPRTDEDDLSDEPWFTTAENDIFPEEFRRFLGLSGALRETFERHHADLFAAGFWRSLQERHRAGEILDVFPYPRARRLDG